MYDDMIKAFKNDYGPFLGDSVNSSEVKQDLGIYKAGWNAHEESQKEFNTDVKRLLLDMVEHISTPGNMITNQSDLYEEMTRIMADHNIRGYGLKLDKNHKPIEIKNIGYFHEIIGNEEIAFKVLNTLFSVPQNKDSIMFSSEHKMYDIPYDDEGSCQFEVVGSTDLGDLLVEFIGTAK